MAKSARAGELRTRIQVFAPVEGGVDADGYPIEGTVNVFGEGGSRRCKWVNAYGREVYDARQAGVTEPATLTMRYTDKVTTVCTVYKGDDPKPYEVISVNDVEERHAWLEVKVQRRSAAK